MLPNDRCGELLRRVSRLLEVTSLRGPHCSIPSERGLNNEMKLSNYWFKSKVREGSVVANFAFLREVTDT